MVDNYFTQDNSYLINLNVIYELVSKDDKNNEQINK